MRKLFLFLSICFLAGPSSGYAVDAGCYLEFGADKCATGAIQCEFNEAIKDIVNINKYGGSVGSLCNQYVECEQKVAVGEDSFLALSAALAQCNQDKIDLQNIADQFATALGQQAAKLKKLKRSIKRLKKRSSR